MWPTATPTFVLVAHPVKIRVAKTSWVDAEAAEPRIIYNIRVGRAFDLGQAGAVSVLARALSARHVVETPLDSREGSAAERQCWQWLVLRPLASGPHRGRLCCQSSPSPARPPNRPPPSQFADTLILI